MVRLIMHKEFWRRNHLENGYTGVNRAIILQQILGKNS
jgi:hypothetical protein